MYNSMHLYPKKTFILMTFRSPSDAATILKIPRIDAGSEPEIVMKLIENYYLKLKKLQMHCSYNWVPIY